MSKKVCSRDAVRKEWLASLEELLDTIANWAAENKWPVDRQEKQITEDRIGAHSTCMLTILTPNGQLVVEPIAQGVTHADGRVDLYAWPSLNRVRLLRVEERWLIRTDSGVDLKDEWGRETFVELAQDLATA